MEDYAVHNPAYRYKMSCWVMELREGPDIEIVMYDSLSDAIDDLRRIAERVESRLAEIRRYRDELSRKGQGLVNIISVLEELGGSVKIPESFIEITGIRIYIDPRPYEELKILDEAIAYMADRVNVIRKIIVVLEELSSKAGLGSVRAYIQYRAGVPVKIVLKQ